jgi:hypothetical protein
MEKKAEGLDLRSSLLTLGKTDASIVLLSLNRSLPSGRTTGAARSPIATAKCNVFKKYINSIWPFVKQSYILFTFFLSDLWFVNIAFVARQQYNEAFVRKPHYEIM